MPHHAFQSSVTPPTAFTPPTTERPTASDADLAALYAKAAGSSSLIGSRHAVRVAGKDYMTSKFLLLGQRGGGTPIPVALLAGVNSGQDDDTTAAVARLLAQFERAPQLARDYALFAYPRINPLQPEGDTDDDFLNRLPTDREEVRFLQRELREWAFQGVVILRKDPEGHDFHAAARNTLIGREVVQPALESVLGSSTATAGSVRISPANLMVTPGVHPRDGRRLARRITPFEVEVFAPGKVDEELRISGLVLVVQELLRSYRKFIVHAANL